MQFITADRQATSKFYWEVTLTTAVTTYAVRCANSNTALATIYATQAMPSNLRHRPNLG
jgi:hypothetical protein